MFFASSARFQALSRARIFDSSSDTGVFRCAAVIAPASVSSRPIQTILFAIILPSHRGCDSRDSYLNCLSHVLVGDTRQESPSECSGRHQRGMPTDAKKTRQQHRGGGKSPDIPNTCELSIRSVLFDKRKCVHDRFVSPVRPEHVCFALGEQGFA